MMRNKRDIEKKEKGQFVLSICRWGGEREQRSSSFEHENIRYLSMSVVLFSCHRRAFSGDRWSPLSLSRCFSLAAELSLDADLLELIIFEFISSARLSSLTEHINFLVFSLDMQMIVLLLKSSITSRMCRLFLCFSIAEFRECTGRFAFVVLVENENECSSFELVRLIWHEKIVFND